MRKFLGIGDPVVPSTYPSEVVKLAIERGADEAVVLEGTGIDPAMLKSPRARVSYKQLRVLTQNVLRLVNDPALGLEVASRLVMGRWGALGFATMSAPDLRHALGLVVRYGSLVGPHIEYSQFTDGSFTTLRFDQHIRLGSLRPFVTEMVVGALLAQLRAIAVGPITPERVEFDYPAPSYADQYETFFGCPVVFGAECVQMVFRRADLDAPLKYSCEPTAVHAEAQCESELEASKERKSVVSQVRYLLRNREDGFPDVRTAARSLRTSERSLRRALHESGTSYQTLMDETRRELALDYLTSTRVPVEDIARMAGFSDGRSFRRAFKRWTGMTPGEARRSN